MVDKSGIWCSCHLVVHIFFDFKAHQLFFLFEIFVLSPMAESKVIFELGTLASSDVAEKKEEISIVLIGVVDLVTQATEGNIEDMLDDFEEDESGEESDGELKFDEDDSDIHPMKPSHANFGKAALKIGYVEVMKMLNYIEDTNIIRLSQEDIVPLQQKNEVVVF